MSILQLSLANHIPTHSLSSSYSICGHTHLFLTHKFSLLTLTTPYKPAKSTIIRMGGGPRTFPGGVSKWQWKRMQAKKSKQLLKARLARERQIYEMRKRAELKAAVSELERPWEVVEKAPTLFSVRADEQLKVLADRFQKPGGFDLWSEKDGPQLFETVDGVPSARFFPKGVVHSSKPYGRIGGGDSNSRTALDSSRMLEGDGDRNGHRRSGDDFEGNDRLSAIGSGRVPDNGNRNGNMRDRRNSVSEDGNAYGKMRGGRNRYRRIPDGLSDSDDELGELNLGLDLDLESRYDSEMGMKRNGYSKNSRNLRNESVRGEDGKGAINRGGNEDSYNGTIMRKVNGRRQGFRDSRSGSFNQEESGSKLNGRRPGFRNSRSGSFNQEESGGNRAIRSRGGRFSRGKGSRKLNILNSEVFDMSLQNDGSYEFSDRELEIPKSRKAGQ